MCWFHSLTPEVLVRKLTLFTLQVNSFGFGGTNAVAILDDAYNYLRLQGIRGNHRTQHRLENNLEVAPTVMDPLEPLNAVGVPSSSNGTVMKVPGARSNRPRLLVWSAPDKQSSRRLNDAFHKYLDKGLTDIELDNLAYALAAKRSQFPWRSLAVVSGQDPIVSSRAMNMLSTCPMKATSKSPRIAFVFTGQGAQYTGMGRELLSFSTFRGSLEYCDERLKRLGCRWSLLEVICDAASGVDIHTPEYSQPLTTCLQIALVDLLRSLGVGPTLVLGHSSGEIAAAYASGCLSKDAAVNVAYQRGVLSSRLTENTPKGMSRMMAVGISRHNVNPYLARLETAGRVSDVQVGCVNSPQSITLTGSAEQLILLEKWFKTDGVFSRKLLVPIAYHSRFMDKIAGEYHTAIQGLAGQQIEELVPMISSVSGDVVMPSEVKSPGYWVRNLTSTVEFDAAFSRLLRIASRKPLRQQNHSEYSGLTHVLEVGPHSTLRGPIRQILEASSVGIKPSHIASLARGEDASVSFLKAVGELYSAGFPVDLLRANCLDDSARPIPSDMPHYPFNHSLKYWKESILSQNFRFREVARHDLLGTPSLDWNPKVAQWRNVVRLAELPW